MTPSFVYTMPKLAMDFHSCSSSLLLLLFLLLLRLVLHVVDPDPNGLVWSLSFKAVALLCDQIELFRFPFGRAVLAARCGVWKEIVQPDRCLASIEDVANCLFLIESVLESECAFFDQRAGLSALTFALLLALARVHRATARLCRWPCCDGVSMRGLPCPEKRCSGNFLACPGSRRNVDVVLTLSFMW